MGLKKACIFPTGSLDCIGLSPLLEQSLFSSEVRIKSNSKIKTETPKDRSFRPWFHLAPEAIKPNAQPCLGILQDVQLQILSPLVQHRQHRQHYQHHQQTPQHAMAGPATFTGQVRSTPMRIFIDVYIAR
jgi:hypothetical protein